MSDVSTITSLGHVRYWAKSTPTGAPGIDVKTHCLNVGWVAFYIARHYETLLRQFSVSPNQVAFLATTHDCGKISYDFETQLSSWVSSMGWVVRPGSSRKNTGNTPLKLCSGISTLTQWHHKQVVLTGQQLLDLTMEH